MLVSESRAAEVQPRYSVRPAAQERLLASGESLQITNDVFIPAVTEGLQPAMLQLLADGEVPALHMKKAVDHRWCDHVAEKFAHHPATQKEGVSPPIFSLGSHLYSCPAGEA